MPDYLSASAWSKLCREYDPTAPGLDAALKAYAKSHGEDPEEQSAALETVIQLATAARRKNAKLAEVAEYLDELLKEADAAREKLEDEELDPTGMLDDEKTYRKYLLRMMKKLLKAPLYFAMGLGRHPGEHRIIFHKSHTGKKLLLTLKDETELRKFAWGFAGAHSAERSTLTLALEGPLIAGLKKRGELFLKYFKPLPFDTILLMVDGEPVADLPDASDEAEPTARDEAPPGRSDASAAADEPPGAPAGPSKSEAARKTKLAEALKRLKPLVDKAIESDPARKRELFASLAQIAGEIKDGRLADAQSNILSFGKLLQGLAAQTGSAPPGDAAQRRQRFEDARQRLESQLVEARRASPERSTALLNLWNYALDQGEAGNYKTALSALEQLETAVAKALDSSRSPVQDPVREEPGGERRGDSTANDERRERAMQDWSEARARAVAQLQELTAAFRRTNDPESDAGVVLLQAVAKNLTPRPDSPQAVAELVRYLETDDVILEAETPNPFGVVVDLRAPLLKALAELQNHVA